MARLPKETNSVDQQSSQALLSRIEDDWMAARVRGETESTERLLDDTYQGSTSDGVPQSKEDFVQSVASSRRTFTTGEHTERSIRVYKDVAVSMGIATLRSPDCQNSFRYLRVFRKSRDEWHLIASQSTRIRPA
jgi:hypothetical protein